MWFDLYWGRLLWVARLRGPSGVHWLRGETTTSLPRSFLGLLRGIVAHEVGQAWQLLPKGPTRARSRPAWLALPAAPLPVRAPVEGADVPSLPEAGMFWPCLACWQLSARKPALPAPAARARTSPSPARTAVPR